MYCSQKIVNYLRNGMQIDLLCNYMDWSTKHSWSSSCGECGQSWEAVTSSQPGAVAPEMLRWLSKPAVLETLSRYFDATRERHVASAPVQVGQNF